MEPGTSVEWETLAASELDGEFIETRLQIHWGLQLLGMAARAYGSPTDDDSHTNMEWLIDEGVFAGQPIERLCSSRLIFSPTLQQVGIRTPGFGDADSWHLPGTDLQSLADNLSRHLHELDIEETPKPVELAMPDYDLPDHPVRQGEPFDLLPLESRREFTRWLSNGTRILSAVKDEYPCSTPLAAWPHHLDLALRILLDPDQTRAEQSRSIGVGLSPGDAMFEHPYFYVTPWPYPPAQDLPPLDGGGEWATRGWVGAVLRAETLVQDDDGESQVERVGDFLQSAVDISAALLGTGSGPIC